MLLPSLGLMGVLQIRKLVFSKRLWSIHARDPGRLENGVDGSAFQHANATIFKIFARFHHLGQPETVVWISGRGSEILGSDGDQPAGVQSS